MALPSLPGSYDSGVGSTPMNARRRLVDAELVASVAWLIKLRWIAGLGVLLATWVVEAAFRLDAATGPLVVIGAAILAYNLVFFLWNRRLTREGAPTAAYEQLAKWQVGLDWLAMTLLIHYSGGIESPVILFFMFHIIIASMLFPQRTAFAFALLAIGLMTATSLLEYFGLLPHQAFIGFLDAPLYQNGLYVSAVLLFFASTALIIAYLATSIQERLRQREEEVVELSESLRRATLRLQALNDGARTVGSTLDLSQVLNRLVTSTAQAMGVRAVSIRLLDSSRKRLESVAVYGLSKEYLNKGPVEVENNPLAREVLSGRVINIADAPNSPLLQYPEEARHEGISSMLSTPLPGKDGPLGILRAYATEFNRFTPEDEAFLTAIAAQGSIAIENALAYQAVEALDEAKSQFVRMVTHELRSPVSVMRSLLRTVSGGFAGEVSTQQRDILERVSRRAEFLQGLIDDLLDLAAGKTDVKVQTRMEPVVLPSVVERVVRRYELSAREKGVGIEWVEEPACKSVTVMATPEGLDRVFDNLVSNAVKYTPRGGQVTVSLTCTQDEAHVVVVDTGIGIPADALGHLFEEFYRAPNAKEMEREGTGLGLTIVKDTVTRLGGTITLESELNAGSRFTVMLPLYEVNGAGEGLEQAAAVKL